jgi:hypothetical protein
MNHIRTELLRDPLFQLNIILWLTQPMPPQGSITPLLHQKGFSVYAIAPALSVPPGIALAVQGSSLQTQQRVRPDVVLKRETDLNFALVECKASSFGVATEQAIQARTFLLLADELLAEVLGLSPEQIHASILAYALPHSESALLKATLSTLSNELRRHHLPTGDSTIIGLDIDSRDLRVVFDKSGSRFFSIASGSHTVMQVQPGDDPRPLYFIPYDPDVHQSPEENLFCKRILFERIHSVVLAAVGRASSPESLTLNIDNLLNEATFGMFGLWENRESLKHMRGMCRQLITALARAVNKEVKGSLSYEPPEELTVVLSDTDQHHQVLAAIERFSCESMDLKEQSMPDLFDDLFDA